MTDKARAGTSLRDAGDRSRRAERAGAFDRVTAESV
jgi:hypothetical protein